MCETCSKLTVKTPERRSGVFTVNFEHISHILFLDCFYMITTPFMKELNRFTFFASWKQGKYTLCKYKFYWRLFFRFYRYCNKVVLDHADTHSFWAPALTKRLFFQYFFTLTLSNDSRNERVSAFLLCFDRFETVNFYIFFIKMSCFGSNLFF